MSARRQVCRSAGVSERCPPQPVSYVRCTARSRLRQRESQAEDPPRLRRHPSPWSQRMRLSVFATSGRLQSLVAEREGGAGGGGGVVDRQERSLCALPSLAPRARPPIVEPSSASPGPGAMAIDAFASHGMVLTPEQQVRNARRRRAAARSQARPRGGGARVGGGRAARPGRRPEWRRPPPLRERTGRTDTQRTPPRGRAPPARRPAARRAWTPRCRSRRARPGSASSSSSASSRRRAGRTTSSRRARSASRWWTACSASASCRRT